MLSECGPEHAFLSLGLKTILVNIGSSNVGPGGFSSGYSSGGGGGAVAAGKCGTKSSRSRNFGSSLSLQSDVSSGAETAKSFDRYSKNDLNKI